MKETEVNGPAPAIGIDLGTCYCCVGVFENGTVKIIPNEHGNSTTPSFVAFTETSRLIGEIAKDQWEVNPKNTIFDVKRLLGRRYWDPVVQSNLDNWPFEIICDGKGRPKLCAEYRRESKWLYPEEVVAMTLLKMKETAEAYLKKTVTDAVVSIPVYFNSYQRQAVRTAGEIVGLNVVRVTSETTLAAFAYGFRYLKMRPPIPCLGEQIVVFLDIGGGSVAVSVVGIDDGYFEVKATAGDPCVGGQDLNVRVVTHFVELFESLYHKDINKDKRALLRLVAAAEKAKRLLSMSSEASVTIKNLADGKDFDRTLTRAQFEKLNDDLLRSILQPIDKALQDAKLNKCDVKDIVLLGGCSRIPKIEQLVQEYFNKKLINTSFDADKTVATGAAIQAAILSGDPKVPDIHLSDRTYFSLGVEDTGGKMAKLIKGNSALAAKGSQTFSCVPDENGNVLFQIFEGEGALTKDNIYLGKIVLPGLYSGARRAQDVVITFETNENSVLNVSASCASAFTEKKVVIYTGLRRIEMQRLKNESFAYKSDDETEKQRVGAKEQLVNYCVNVQGTLLKKEHLGWEDRSIILDACKDANEWVQYNGKADKKAFEEKLETLQAVCYIVTTTPFSSNL